jgi:hypothetical protein
MVDPIEDDVVEFRFTEDFGGIRSGETLRFPAAGNENVRSYLPVEARGAKVVAVDGHGRPALLRNTVGDGEAVLCTYPLEHLAAAGARVNPEDSYRIYDALADVAGVARRVTSGDPRVLTDTLVHADGRRFAWFVSEHDGEATVTPDTRGAALRTLSGESVTSVTLPPFGVRVFELVARS